MSVPFINIHCHLVGEKPDEIVDFRPEVTEKAGSAPWPKHAEAGVMSVINCDFDEPLQPLSSVGVHPWHSAEAGIVHHFIEESVALVAQKGTDPRVVAIGEAGLDRLRGAGLDQQRRLFEMQVEISEQVGKPMIIHVVRFTDEIVQIRKRMHPRQAWIIHGFRGKPSTAVQLMSHGLDLSFGPFFNAQSLHEAYRQNRLWLETDEACTDIISHYTSVAKALGVDVEALKATIYERATLLSSAFRQE